MCSTPRPKTKVKGKKSHRGSVLSNMSPGVRSRFAECANSAQERRHQIALTTQKIAEKPQHNLLYWLVSASIKEIFLLLFLGSSKPKAKRI